MKKYENFDKMKLLSISIIVFILILSTSCMTMHHLGTGRSSYSQLHLMNLADPVCGMEVNSDAALSSNYEGTIFYFDSEECLMLFNKNPEQFAYRSMRMHNRNTRNEMSAAVTMGGVAMVTMMIIMMFTMGAH